MFNLDTSEIFVSRDVNFHENIFPFESRGKEETLVEGGRTLRNEVAGSELIGQGGSKNTLGRGIIVAKSENRGSVKETGFVDCQSEAKTGAEQWPMEVAGDSGGIVDFGPSPVE